MSCSDFSKFDAMHDADFYETHDILVARRPTMNKTAFDSLEQTMGVTLNETGRLGKISRILSARAGKVSHCALPQRSVRMPVQSKRI